MIDTGLVVLRAQSSLNATQQKKDNSHRFLNYFAIQIRMPCSQKSISPKASDQKLGIVQPSNGNSNSKTQSVK